jgi:hypothetical protein
MHDKVDELIRRNRTLLRLAEVVRARTEALSHMAPERHVVGRSVLPNRVSEAQERLAREGRRNSAETPS